MNLLTDLLPIAILPFIPIGGYVGLRLARQHERQKREGTPEPAHQ